MNRSALAHRSGVLSNPSRPGSSPMHLRMVLHADVMSSSFSSSLLGFPTSWHKSDENGCGPSDISNVRFLFLESSNHNRSSSHERVPSESTESRSFFEVDEVETDDTSAGVGECDSEDILL